MRNITVSVSEGVYKRARIQAAERGTSVSAMVAEFLVSLSRDDSEFDRLEQEQRRITSEIETFSASHRLDRADLHHRALR